jgi:hypothetical protein
MDTTAERVCSTADHHKKAAVSMLTRCMNSASLMAERRRWGSEKLVDEQQPPAATTWPIVIKSTPQGF